MAKFREEDIKINSTIYRKPTEIVSEHPKSFEDSISYSQVLRVKTISSSTTDYEKHCKTLNKKFKQRSYLESFLK